MVIYTEGKNPNYKSKDQISVIENVEKFFDLREKIIDCFRNYLSFFCDLKLNTKQKMKNDSK